MLTAIGVGGCSEAGVTERASQLQCLTGRQTREFGYHLTAFSVRAPHDRPPSRLRVLRLGHPRADAVVAKVGLEAQGQAGFNGQGLSANAAARLSETGAVIYDLDTHERTFRAELKGKGLLQAGISPQRLPVEARGMLGGTGSGAIEVTFGPDGEPKTLTLVTKHGYSYGGKANIDSQAIPGQQKELSMQKRKGRLRVTKARLDLTVPENRAAFESLFQPVGGSAVVPKPQSPGDYQDNLIRLGNRFARDGLFTRSTYGRDVTGGTGDVKSIGGRTIKGGEGLAFGGEHQNDTTVINLRGARVIDMRNPNAHWSPQPTCNLAGS